MFLSEYQQEMLDGKYGKGKAMAMQILEAVGDSFEAQRMVPISRAHISLSAQDADVWFAEKMWCGNISGAFPEDDHFSASENCRLRTGRSYE